MEKFIKWLQEEAGVYVKEGRPWDEDERVTEAIIYAHQEEIDSYLLEIECETKEKEEEEKNYYVDCLFENYAVRYEEQTGLSAVV